MNRIQKALVAFLATLSLTGLVVAADTGSASAAGTHKYVFKAWGRVSYAKVDIVGHHDITLRRHLPFSQTQYLSGLDASFAMMSVEIPGFKSVGCSITRDGKLVARDVSPGMALCMS